MRIINVWPGGVVIQQNSRTIFVELDTVLSEK
jgi:hypothetical protein